MPLQKTTKRGNDAYVRRLRLRRERAESVLNEFLDKSVPPLPVAGGIAGWTRWLKAIANIETQMTMVRDEMENYQQSRSTQWKRSRQGYLFEKKLEDLMRVMDEVTGWPDCQADRPNDSNQARSVSLHDPLKRDVTLQRVEGGDDATA